MSTLAPRHDVPYNHPHAPQPSVGEIAALLGQHAHELCRRYLPAGRREARFWTAGNLDGDKGRSLQVRLAPPGTPGKWWDASTGEHGDLLDLIRHRLGGVSLRTALTEARAFLALAPASPPPTPEPTTASRPHRALQRIWRACGPIDATAAETYLAARAITATRFPTLRFHPALDYRDETGTRAYPALVAAVTDTNGRLAAVHRTYLDPERPVKARVAHPHKSLGPLQHHSVRFTPSTPLTDAASTLLIGEGIETVLSLVSALPRLSAVAALSAGQLGAFRPPPGTRQLLIACDNDPAGVRAAAALAERTRERHLPTLVLTPVHGDFNDDLVRLGANYLAHRLQAALEVTTLASSTPTDPSR